MREKFTVTKGVGRCRNIVSNRSIRHLKKQSHKALRRYAKNFIRLEGESYSPSPKLTSWDIC